MFEKRLEIVSVIHTYTVHVVSIKRLRYFRSSVIRYWIYDRSTKLSCQSQYDFFLLDPC